MAWYDVDFRKCQVVDWNDYGGSHYEISTDGKTFHGGYPTYFQKGYHRVHAMRVLDAGTLTAGDNFQIRYTFQYKYTDTWNTNGGIAIGTLFGNNYDADPSLGRSEYTDEVDNSNFFHLSTSCRDVDGSNNIRLFIWTVVNNGAKSYTNGNINLAINTTYYITIDYNPTGGAGGSPRVTATIRTGSHTGPTVETVTHDLSGTGLTHDLKCFSPECSDEIWSAAYSDVARWDIWDVQTNFDHGSDDQSKTAGYNVYDLTTFTEVDPQSRFTITSNLLDNYNGGSDKHNKESDDTIVYKELNAAPTGDFFVFAEHRTSGDDYFLAHLPSLATIADVYHDVKTAGGDCLAPSILFDASVIALNYFYELDAGTEHSASGPNLGNSRTNIWYWTRMDYVESEGANGTVYVKRFTQHPKYFPWCWSSLSYALDMPISSNMKYFFAFQAEKAQLGGGARYSNLDVRNVYGKWLEDTAGPVLQNALVNVNGDQLTLIFDETLQGTPNGFTLKVNGSTVGLSNGVLSFNQITFDIDTTVLKNQTCLLSYSGTYVKDINIVPNNLDPITDHAVVNNALVVSESLWRRFKPTLDKKNSRKKNRILYKKGPR